MKYTFVGVFNYNSDDIYTITFPDVPGAISEGKGVEDSLKQAHESLATMLLWLEDEGEDVKQPSPISSLKEYLGDDNDFLQFITVDTELERKVLANKSVNKMVTLPAWLVDLGKEKKVNFSQTLQRALREELGV